MRLFIAVDLDERLQRVVADRIGDLRRLLAASGIDDHVRWVATEQLHLTLHFIGYVDDQQAGLIRAALEPGLTSPPCRLSLAGMGAFPTSGAARVIWLGADAGADALRAVYQEVSARLKKAGCSPEEREFRAHLTIGRVRKPDRRLTHRMLRGLSLDPSGEDRKSTRLNSSHSAKSRMPSSA